MSELRVGEIMPGRIRRAVTYKRHGKVEIMGWLTEAGERVLRDELMTPPGYCILITLGPPGRHAGRWLQRDEHGEVEDEQSNSGD